MFGNPPFVGAKFQTEDQRAQVRRIAALGKSGGTLDYVAAWFIKAGGYVQSGNARIGFVATNSITQGEQVAQLWPVLFDRCKLEIAFAHRTFAWGSDARGKAHVHVVILGLDRREVRAAQQAPVQLFRHQRRARGKPSRGALAVSVRCKPTYRSSTDGARGKRADQRYGKTDYRNPASRRRESYVFERGQSSVSRTRTSFRPILSTVSWSPRVHPR